MSTNCEKSISSIRTGTYEYVKATNGGPKALQRLKPDVVRMKAGVCQNCRCSNGFNVIKPKNLAQAGLTVHTVGLEVVCTADPGRKAPQCSPKVKTPEQCPAFIRALKKG